MESRLWVWLPTIVGRQSTLLGLVMSDGQYLRHIHLAKINLLFASLAIGLIAGIFHPSFFGFPNNGDAFSTSLLFTAFALFVGTSSAHAGLWLIVGYALGDVFFYQDPLGSRRIIGSLAGLLLSYVLLFQLVCVIPLMSRAIAQKSFANQTEERSNISGASNFLVVAVALIFVVLLIYSWTAAFPYLIRPFHVFAGGTMRQMTVSAIQINFPKAPPIYHPLIIIGGIALFVRLMIERKEPTALPPLEAPDIKPRRWPPLLAIPAKAAFTTFMLAGLIESWLAAVAIFLAWLGLFYTLSTIEQKWGGWFRMVEKIPFLIRVAIGFVGAFATAFAIFKLFEGQVRDSRSLLPILLCGMLGAVFFALLIPPLKAAQSEEEA